MLVLLVLLVTHQEVVDLDVEVHAARQAVQVLKRHRCLPHDALSHHAVDAARAVVVGRAGDEHTLSITQPTQLQGRQTGMQAGGESVRQARSGG